jgi:hypothetical protein
MALSLGFDSPSDLLSKVERDLCRIEAAIPDQDQARVGDALYDFSAEVASAMDWLKAHPAKSYADSDVEDFARIRVASSAFRDIANADKHRYVTRDAPATSDARFSAYPACEFAPLDKLLGRSRTRFRPKIARADGARRSAIGVGANLSLNDGRADHRRAVQLNRRTIEI